jgi:hypothetical protein
MLPVQGSAHDTSATIVLIIALAAVLVIWWRLLLVILVVGFIATLGLGAEELLHQIHHM